MTLRNSLVSKIWAAIEKSPFTAADFNVYFDDDRNQALLLIEFRYDSNFYFKVYENHDGEEILNVSPGKYKREEVSHLSSLSKIPEEINSWTRNIRDELRATIPVYTELDLIREKIERHVAEHIENPETPFSKEEADKLKEKLDEVMTRFQELQQRSNITEQELKRLNREIDSIKSNLNAYPRGVWYKTAANKIWATISKITTSQESRQIMAQAAKKLLGLDSTNS